MDIKILRTRLNDDTSLADLEPRTRDIFFRTLMVELPIITGIKVPEPESNTEKFLKAELFDLLFNHPVYRRYNRGEVIAALRLYVDNQLSEPPAETYGGLVTRKYLGRVLLLYSFKRTTILFKFEAEDTHYALLNTKPPESGGPDLREIALDCFQAYLIGYLRPAYILPALYPYLVKKGVLAPKAGPEFNQLITEAANLRVALLQEAGADAEYIQSVTKDFANGRATPVEVAAIDDCARRLEIIHLFDDLKENSFPLNQLI